MVKVIASIGRPSVDLAIKLLKDKQTVTMSKSSLIVDLQMSQRKGNVEIYKIPLSFRDIADFGVSGCESGCKGIATMFSHFDGTSLRPYRVHNGMAFFCMKEGFVLGEIYGNVITLTECLIEVDYKRSEIILIKERIWHNPYEQISIAGVKYPDLCKALIQRAAMKYIPDQPIYFDSFGV